MDLAELKCIKVTLLCGKTLCRQHLDDNVSFGKCQFCHKQYSVPEEENETDEVKSSQNDDGDDEIAVTKQISNNLSSKTSKKIKLSDKNVNEVVSKKTRTKTK